MGESMVSAPQSAADQTEAGMLPEKNKSVWRFHAVNSRAGRFLWQSGEKNSKKLLVFIVMAGMRCASCRTFPRCRHNSAHPQVRRRYSAEGGNPCVRIGASGSTHFPHVLTAGSLIHPQPELRQYGQQMVEDVRLDTFVRDTGHGIGGTVEFDGHAFGRGAQLADDQRHVLMDARVAAQVALHVGAEGADVGDASRSEE